MLLSSSKVFASLLALPSAVFAQPHCKLSPLDAEWPSTEEWAALNTSIQGALIKTAPAASSCYPGNPFGSTENCTIVKNYWSYAAYHSAWPESVDYSIYTNNSCVPPGVAGYTEGRGCSIGALPQYIVNATTEEQVAKAMQWASDRNIRMVVKGTGHDLSGRSTSASVMACACLQPHRGRCDHWSGNTWGSIYTAVHAIHRTVIGAEDATVGPGGLIQNGGHGLLSSHYGLASDQAVRGGGGGQFGVVTEFVLKTYPVPANVVTGSLSFYPNRLVKESELASWDAFVETARMIPDLMDSTIEPVWRRWAPDTGSYMNEGSAFSSTWKNDFYGENYDRLLAIKRKYDPNESLFIWSGVGSDTWTYDLRSGLLCRR
ncbi:putative isoamyl alcohol oxidase [Aspergillus thermomutatus]|uniref:FAD-binding PCMH-type domain-containing protein n=1 Tax=Aspergillus thermomutatus TaxID=41047 RepID=A0A397I021_ASPTH|nr:uncharacterized protein CDV56_106013 [Aspergillus thermomutatus]RHZ67136.1 hypothetical protein CDV56_106013 [Aspergillus thermomutatus]